MDSFGRFSRVNEDPELLRLLYDSNPTLVFVKDRKGRFVFANKALADVYNVSIENLMGKTDADFNPDIGEIEHFLADDLRVMDEQQELFIPEEKVTGPDGSLVWLQTIKRPLIDDDGNCNHILGVCVDITERVEAVERERNLRKRLERYQRLDSLGVMAGGIAHDLNNILGPLIAYPELICSRITDTQAIRMVNEMQKSAERAVSMIDNLLTLARRGNYKAEPINLVQCIHEFLQSAALEHIQSEHKDKQLELALADELPIVLGSDTHVHQILLNLVKNAYEATAENGHVRIGTSQEDCDRVFDGFEEVPAGSFCVIRIKDNGSGISSKELERIFEPFYSSKIEGGRGTGLGLAMVYGVAKDLGASIEVQSENNVGTEFIIRIPIAHGESIGSQSDDLNLRGDARVLLIDDLDIQRQLGGRMLSALGYRVDIASDSIEALALLEKHKGKYDVIVSDMLLENEDGLDIFYQVRALFSNIPYIIASGYAESGRVKQALDEGVCAFVRKPYTQAALGRAVKSALHDEKDS